jgi:hypothetical protein
MMQGMDTNIAAVALPFQTRVKFNACRTVAGHWMLVECTPAYTKSMHVCSNAKGEMKKFKDEACVGQEEPCHLPLYGEVDYRSAADPDSSMRLEIETASH